MQLMIRRVQPSHMACLVLLIVHAMLTMVYSFTNPIWDSYDEPGHYAYARYVAQHRALPPLNSVLSAFNESHQPPLYYLLASIPIAFVDTSDNAQPIFTAGGKTWVIANERVDAFPYRGTALALRLSRMVSMLLSTIAVALTYMTVRSGLPGRNDIALLATALHALWPLFLFLGGAVSNDVGMALFGSFTLLFVVRLWAKPPGQSRRKDYIALAISLACAVWTKDAAFALLLFSALAMAAMTVRDVLARRTHVLTELVFLVTPLFVLIIAGGILSEGRSFRQFQSVASASSASVRSVAAAVHTDVPTASRDADFLRGVISRLQPDMWQETMETLFGGFSWGTLKMPHDWFTAALFVIIPALIGIVLSLTSTRTRGFMLLMLLCFACVYAGPVIRGVLSGRFLFAGLSAMMAALAMGYLSLPRPLGRISATCGLATIGLAAIMSPSIVMAPAYQRVPLLDPAVIPEGIQIPTALTYGDANGPAIRLLGYSHPYHRTARGEDAVITLYWRALRTLVRDHGLRIELFTTQGKSFETSYRATPGNNNFPTSFWQPGDTFMETYHLPLRLDAPAPSLVTFKVTWFDQQTNETLTPICEDNVVCEPKLGALPVMLDRASIAQWAGKPALYRFGALIELLDMGSPITATAGQTLTLPLVWRSTSTNLPALTTFVHLVSADGELVAQSDTPPHNGGYPTNIWNQGEVIPDVSAVRLPPDLPPGAYELRLGLYDSQTGQRLPAFDAKGTALRDNAITLTDITVR